jgi:two-component system, NarL family, response regulator LiaR
VSAPLITVVLVEDHALTRLGLRNALEADGDIQVVAEAGDGISAEEVVRREHPMAAIIDLGLPGRDGVALTRAIKSSVPQTRTLILTMNELDTEVLAAISAGADGYCVKSSNASTVVEALRIVAGGGAYFDPRVAHIVLRQLGVPALKAGSGSPLTPRELDILRLAADGLGNGEIAAQLNISLGTVKGHMRDILEKLSANDRTHAAVSALRRGFL